MEPLYRGEEPSATVERAPLVGAALAIGLLCSAIALGLFIWLGYQARAEPSGFDLTIREAVRSFQSPALTSIMWGASVYGAPRLLAPLALIAAVVFVFRGWQRAGFLTVTMIVGAVLLDGGLKRLFGRVRPEPFFDFYPAPASFSFPSGHALFATCFFGGIAVLRLPPDSKQACPMAALARGPGPDSPHRDLPDLPGRPLSDRRRRRVRRRAWCG